MPTKDQLLEVLLSSSKRDAEVAAELRNLTSSINTSRDKQDAEVAAELRGLSTSINRVLGIGEDHTAIAKDRIRIEKAKQKNRQATIKIVLSSQAASSGVVLVIYIIASLMGVDLGVLSL